MKNQNKDNRKAYLIKTKEIKLDNTADMEEREINNLIKSSALLMGLEFSKSKIENYNLNESNNSKNKYLNKKRQPESNSIANWTCPKLYSNISPSIMNEARKAFKLLVDGDEIPPMIDSFKAMKFPIPILKALQKKQIIHPTPIQMQGLPVVLSGRDAIGIAFTGTGKSLVFILPALMLALQEETKAPIEAGEGPIGIIIVPSRELAVQLHEFFNFFVCSLLKYSENKNQMLKSVLCIGGVDIKYQKEEIMRGCHIVIGTPGRLSDLMEKRKLDTSFCKYLVLDEADRLLDMGFDEEIRKVLEKFEKAHQTLIFSSTMPKKIQEFAKKCLNQPVVMNIGRAGSANLNVLQDVEFVKDESKLIQILDTLQKTPPPVLIFCENKNDVDEIHEYLLLKGIGVCSMHGDKDQEERNQAIREFREGLKDILVATDIVSKGLDFPDIEHVINYDMPKEIENYVLRIGRTGRLGRLGLATTYVNRNLDEAILLDLKHLLVESQQVIPPFLMSLQEDDPSLANQECTFCGGLGHKLSQCHKFENQRMKSLLNKQSVNLSESLKSIGIIERTAASK